MHRFSYSTFSRWARPLLGYLAIVLAMTLFGSTLVRPTSVAQAQDAAQDDQQQAAPEAPSATFPGTGVGALADGLAGTPPQFGPPLVVSFAVSGATGPITSMSANFTMTHTWVGDVDVILRAPGGAPSLVLVSRIGVVSAGSFGDSSEFGGTYNFTDSAAGTNIWTVATAVACGDLCVTTAGDYRTTGPGQTGQTNPAPVTSLQTTFGGLTAAQINGTWTMTFRDAGADDLGTVTAANLTLNFAAPPVGCTTAKRPSDYNGDGKTDYSVVRNTGGGPGGQLSWFNLINGGAVQPQQPWGLQGDEFVPLDYDGDGKTDIAVWRAGPGPGVFHILQSQTNTVRSFAFGLPTDDPSVTADYDGDGKADPAVYRGGATSNDPSYWLYLSSATNNTVVQQWGKGGDFSVPGDFDGDLKADFVVQRNDGGGSARYHILSTSTNAYTSVVFGTPTDVILPGNYDSDCKADLVVVRSSGGQILWSVLNSSDGSYSFGVFGISATDFPAPGDYDGDGRNDFVVWRPSITPGGSSFYVHRSSDGIDAGQAWGQNGDYPPANYNNH